MSRCGRHGDLRGQLVTAPTRAAEDSSGARECQSCGKESERGERWRIEYRRERERKKRESESEKEK